MCINALKERNRKEGDGDSDMMEYLHRSAKRKTTVSANLDKVLANYIRIFEPMVIRSLKVSFISSVHNNKVDSELKTHSTLSALLHVSCWSMISIFLIFKTNLVFCCIVIIISIMKK